LANNIDKLIKEIVTKGRKGSVGNNFKLHVTGYPKFFDPGYDDYCNSVTFARTANPTPDGKDHPILTVDLRTTFNQMSDDLNKAVQAAVARNTADGAKFINVEIANGQDQLKGHRFCEPGVNEPDQNNVAVYFRHYPYNQVKDTTDDPTINVLSTAYNKTVGTMDIITINQKWPLTVDLFDDMVANIDSSKINDKVNPDGSSAGWDTIGYRAKVFHPQTAYATFIRDQVLAAYKADTQPNPPPPPPAPSQDKQICHGISGNVYVSNSGIAIQNAQAFCK
jgi:hypothetical protein